MASYSTTTKIPRDLFNLIFFGNLFQKHKVKLFDYQELDSVRKNSLVKMPSELWSKNNPATIVLNAT